MNLFQVLRIFSNETNVIALIKVQPSMIWFLEYINIAHYYLMRFDKEIIIRMQYIFEQFGQYCDYQHCY